MKNRYKNKRGDIPVTILVLGVFAICLLAIFSFYLADRHVRNDFSSIGIIEKAKILRDKVVFYSDEKIGMDEAEIKQLFNQTEGVEISSDREGKYIYLESGGVSVKYLIP